MIKLILMLFSTILFYINKFIIEKHLIELIIEIISSCIGINFILLLIK